MDAAQDDPPIKEIKLPVAANVDIAVKTAETVEDAQHRRHKDLLLFYVVLAFVVLLALTLLWVAFLDRNVTDQQRQWAWTGLTTIVAGFIGYLFGKGDRPA